MPKDPCSELSKTITELAMNIGTRPEVKNLDDVVAHMKKLIPEIERESLVASINEATTGYAKARDEMAKKLDRLKREARNDTQLRKAVQDLDAVVKGGTFVPSPTKTTKAPPEAIAKLRAERDRLREIIDLRDPAKRKAIVDRISELDKHIMAGTMPPPKASKPVPNDIAALRKIRDEKLRQVRMVDPEKRAAVRKEIAELSKAIQDQQYVTKDKPVGVATPADLKKLRDERDALRAKVEKFNPDRVADWEKKVSVLEDHISKGTLPAPKDAVNPELNPRVAELKDKADALRSALAKSDAAIKQRYLRDIENLTDRLEAGVFTLPEPKIKRPMEKDIADLDYQRHQLKQQIQRKLDALKPKTIWGLASEPFNAARAMMTSLDVSAVLRQGGFIAIGNPVRAARELPDMFRAMASDKRAYEINKAIFERENASLYHRDGLFLSEPGFGGLNQQEEAFVSRLAGKLPGVKASERAYVTFLNKLRADSYDAMTAALARGGNATAEEGAAIANFINVATGRGKLPGAMSQAAPLLNATFFAPRLAISRFQVILGQPMYGGTAATRMAIAKEYAKFLGGIGVVYGLGALAGGKVEVDPRSSDFGKIRFGETRLDPLAGLSQATVLTSRLITQSTKRADGKIEKLDGSGMSNSVDTAFDFLRTKFSPVVGAVANWRAGETVVGEKTSLAKEAGKLFVPLSFQDIYKAMQDQGIPRGTALSVLSLFGMGMNTYGPRTKSGDKLDELRAAGMSESGIAKQIERLNKQYEGADQAGRDQIEAQLARLNTSATRILNERRKADEKRTTK